MTLSTILLAQRPPSRLYPLGYGKFESLGTVTVSIFLLLGGIGIGAHSWGLLSEALATNSSLPPFLLRILSYLTPSDSDHGHSHSHGAPVDGEDLSPTAVLFPLFGILVKEYLYRVTKRVADEQNSSVLMANALHHRSDAYSSIVTVVAILGSLVIKGAPFDPLGGMSQSMSNEQALMIPRSLRWVPHPSLKCPNLQRRNLRINRRVCFNFNTADVQVHP